MKSKFLSLLLVFVATISYAQKQVNFKIDQTKSIVKWSGKKIVGGNTEGTIHVLNGSLLFKGEQLKGGEVTMDTKSIQSEKASKRLVDHLKNEDFFDVEKFPTAKFVVTKVSGVKNQATITGQITIKGITKELSFPADITIGKDVAVVKASQVKVDRTKFGVEYRSGSIFADLGNGAIEDNFILDIILVGAKK